MAKGLRILEGFDNFISGQIPSQLGNISRLQQLVFYENHITGTIPSELGNMKTLQALSLYQNSITGSVPSEMGMAKELQILYVYDNFISGQIPSQLGNISGLQQLCLYVNLITGTIPSELGNIKSLQALSLYQNSITGTIPTELGNLGEIEDLYLFENSITGGIPTQLVVLKYLQALDLHQNSITGHFPSEIRYVQDLWLSSNSLTGSIPFFNFTNLELLYLDSNFFTGSFPLFPSSYDLIIVDLSVNLFTGTIPSWLLTLPSLEILNISSNFLEGSIPVKVDAHNMTSMDFSDNAFTGSVSPSLFLSTSLVMVSLHSNCFESSLPPSICDAVNLETLLLDRLGSGSSCVIPIPKQLQLIVHGIFPLHFLQGTIPDCMWSMSSLITLRLSGNGLHGTIGNIPANSNLSYLSLSSNFLSGSIPISMQKRGNEFKLLDLSLNKLSGYLTNDFTLSNETELDLTVNRLSGGIPSSFMSGGRSVDVLEGNLFECDLNSEPQQDPSKGKYVCGSDDLNIAVFVWLCCLMIGTIVGVLGLYRVIYGELLLFPRVETPSPLKESLIKSRYDSNSSRCGSSMNLSPQSTRNVESFSMTDERTTAREGEEGKKSILKSFQSYTIDIQTRTVTWWRRYESVMDKCKGELTETWELKKLQTLICSSCVRLSVAYLIAGSSCFIAFKAVNDGASNEFSTHTSQYTWIITAAYLHGWAPAAFVTGSLWVSVWWISLSGKDNRAHEGKIEKKKVESIWIRCGCMLGPLVATLATDSTCLYYIFEGQSAVTSSFQDPIYSFECGSFDEGPFSKTKCFLVIDPKHIASISLFPPWIYSYQCSSALLTNYIPPILLSYTISGMIIPIVRYFIITYDELVDRHMPKVLIRMMLVNTIFSTPQTASLEHNSEQKEEAEIDQRTIPIEDGSFSPITATNSINNNSSSYNGNNNKRILKHARRLFSGSGISMKGLQDMAILISFGLACPLVALAVSIDAITSRVIWRLLIGRYLIECRISSNNKGMKLQRHQQLQRLEEATKGAAKGLFGCIFIVMSVVSIFWGLIVFDMVADVYGDFAGGMSVMGVVVGAWIAHGAALINRDELLSRVRTDIITRRRRMKSKGGVIAMVDMTPHSTMSPMGAMNGEFENGSEKTNL